MDGSDHARSPFDPRTEVGRALAAIDWSATPLGPWQQWPISLATAARAMLASRFAMFMVWGEQSIFLCNDAYRVDSLGNKFPQALGRPMSEVWPEVWDVAEPRIRVVMEQNTATWDEELQLFLQRSGYTEETYHTFTYGPLYDDDGLVAGMLCVVREDTRKVLADRRIALLRDVGTALAAGSTRDELAVAAHGILSGDVPDLPFAVAYLYDPAEPDSLDVYWAAGTVVGSPAAPRSVSAGDDHPWVAPMHRGTGLPQVIDLDPAVEWPRGGWADAPHQALVLPLRQIGRPRPHGHLVVGLNPYREVDDDYLGFVQLLSDQFANALGRADAFELERERHERLAELDRAKTAFFTNVSHELRTPLTLLLGPAADALADTEHPLPDVQRGRVEVVERNAERMLKLVNTLLDFSRLEDGQVTARYERLDLHEFTRELAGMFQGAFERVGVALVVDCVPLPTRPYVDREMWAKIVLNLLSNALKATFEGRVTVRLADDPEHGGALLQVTDTGVGIPPAEQERLFERFHRVAGARLRSHEGTGIGLALVAELARLHGGDIRVDSTPGEGSTFSVRIRYGREHLPAGQVVDELSQDPPDVSGLGAGYLAESLRWSAPVAAEPPLLQATDRPRVLVVDDSADVRDYVRDLLADTYSVTVAADGEAALEAIGRERPDLVITDVMMPRLDGFGLLAALRSHPSAAHLPVIMLSARSGETAAIEGLEAGADDYLIKPFSARELRARVRAALELDRVRQVLIELERSREMLDNAERLAQLGSWEIDLTARTLRVSPEHSRTSGLPAGPTPLGDARQITAPEDAPRLQEAITRAIADHGDIDEEIWAVRATGERFRARVRASVAYDADGEARYLRGSTQDVTEQRAAEAELAAATAMREVARREHAIAAELQRSLLPDSDFANDQLEIASFYRAGVEGTQVGGDWFDVIDLDAGRTALVIGDVMGRGVRAAAVMGQLRAATRAYARLALPPDKLIRLLDDTVCEIGPDTIVTCVYAVYDPATQTLDYANAGHPPPLLRVPGKPVLPLESGGPPLGTGRLEAIGERVDLPAGATLALYTDGLVERRGHDLDQRIGQLAEALSLADGPIDDLPADLVARMMPVDHPDDVPDDIALLVCRGGSRNARHEVGAGRDAVSRARAFVVRVLQEWGVAGALEDDVVLAVSELVTNGIHHGTRPVRLAVRLIGDRLRVAVRDGGAGQPVVRHSGPRDEHGRGLLIVSTLADEWGIDERVGGKTVWCEFVVRPD